MRRLIVFGLAILLLAGCTGKTVNLDFNQVAGGDKGTPGSGGTSINILVIKADGSTLRTDTDQAAEGDLSGAIDELKGAVSPLGGLDIPDIFGKKEETAPAAANDQASPADPRKTVEEID
jgi:hypothetical protein